MVVHAAFLSFIVLTIIAAQRTGFAPARLLDFARGRPQLVPASDRPEL